MEVDALSRKYLEDNPQNIETMTDDEKKTIEMSHLAVGHRGYEAVKYELEKNFTKWKNQKEHIKQVLADCLPCAKNFRNKMG